jgi:hypothetical protein
MAKKQSSFILGTKLNPQMQFVDETRSSRSWRQVEQIVYIAL